MHDHLVTVFGGSGFIGRYVVKHLVGRGARVRVAARRPDEALFLKPLGTVGQVVTTQANLRVPASVAAAVSGADAVINLVGLLRQSGTQSFSAVHAQGAATVAAAASAAGVKQLVQVSAIGADPGSPSAYGRSKAAGEAAARQHFPAATIIRPSVVFGAEDKFFNLFASMARLSPVLPLIGGGKTRFQPVYVVDVAEAIVRTLETPAAQGKTYELGGPLIYSFAELMQLVLRQTGRRRLLVPVPIPLAMLEAFFLEFLPNPPLTRDQVRMLRRDNVADPTLPGLADLGIEPTAAESVLPTYLFRFRRGGARVAPRFG